MTLSQCVPLRDIWKVTAAAQLNIHAKSNSHHLHVHSGTPLPVLGLLPGLAPQAIQTNQVALIKGNTCHTPKDDRPHKEELIDLTLSSPICLDRKPKTTKWWRSLSSDSKVKIVTSKPACKPRKTSHLQSSSPNFKIILPKLGGVGHCYAWHVWVTLGFGIVHFSILFSIGKINYL